MQSVNSPQEAGWTGPLGLGPVELFWMNFVVTYALKETIWGILLQSELMLRLQKEILGSFTLVRVDPGKSELIRLRLFGVQVAWSYFCTCLSSSPTCTTMDSCMFCSIDRELRRPYFSDKNVMVCFTKCKNYNNKRFECCKNQVGITFLSATARNFGEF